MGTQRWRSEQNGTTENTAEHRGGDHTFPSRAPPAEQQQQYWSDQERGPASCNKDNVGEEKYGEDNHPHFRTPPSERVPPSDLGLGQCEAKKRKSANQEFLALDDVVLDRNSRHSRMPEQSGTEHHQP